MLKIFLALSITFMMMDNVLFASVLSNKDQVLSEAVNKKIFEDKYWKILLHYSGNKSLITDSRFFLSKVGFENPREELLATIEAFFSKSLDDSHPICLYPRRFSWLKQVLHLDPKIFPTPKCDKIDRFKKRIGANKIAIVFASENIRHPASMMGHFFLQIRGTYNGQETNHAYSYFAQNNPQESQFLFYINSLTKGTQGLYKLSPFNQILDEYIDEEQRNIWIYDLNFNTNEIESFIEHLWELKDIPIDYNFITHNCGGAAINLLAVANPKIHDLFPKFFSTPIDYIKILNKNSFISNINVFPSDEHKLKMILPNYSYSEILLAKKASFILSLRPVPSDKTLDDEKKLKLYFLIKLLTTINYTKKKISSEQFEKFLKEIAIQENDTTSSSSLVWSMKNPLNNHFSSRINFAYTHKNHSEFLFGFYPAYHSFTDDSREFFDEYESKLLSLELRYQRRFVLNRFQIASMKYIAPFHLGLGSISNSLEISLENASKNEHHNLYANVELGIGLGQGFLQDSFLLYFLVLPGFQTKANFLIALEGGLIFRPTIPIKTDLFYKKYFDSNNKYRLFRDKYSIVQSYYFNECFAMQAQYEGKYMFDKSRENAYTLNFNYYF